MGSFLSKLKERILNTSPVLNMASYRFEKLPLDDTEFPDGTETPSPTSWRFRKPLRALGVVVLFFTLFFAFVGALYGGLSYWSSMKHEIETDKQSKVPQCKQLACSAS